MSTTLADALIVPWVFWGALMGLLIATGRSWINLVLFPIITTVVILAIASLASVREAFWTSFIVHLFLFVFFLGSYVAFVLRERKNRRGDSQ
jgi:hypothetical protein